MKTKGGGHKRWVPVDGRIEEPTEAELASADVSTPFEVVSVTWSHTRDTYVYGFHSSNCVSSQHRGDAEDVANGKDDRSSGFNWALRVKILRE